MSEGTKHSSTCKMAFGRKDPTCARCQELLAGAAPRAAWNKKPTILYSRAQELQMHDCKKSHCNPICCTFGDW